VIPDFIEQYVDTGKVRYVYREFPLTNLHPAAQQASEAAVCAGEQGSYWEMNETLFATTDEWSQAEDPTEYFKGYAKDLGLDTKAFAECLDSGQAAAQVLGDLMAGQELYQRSAHPWRAAHRDAGAGDRLCGCRWRNPRGHSRRR
jgi:protein-disulfide isomerase